MIPRDECEAAFFAAVRACSPTRLVSEALERNPIPLRPDRALIQPRIGLAVGKAAQAMARAIEVARGLCITNIDDGVGLPAGWKLMLASHPLPDESSVAAGMAALSLFESAGDNDTIVALISGGASSLLELPAPGISLDELRRRTAEAMASGASIHELNRLRTELSALKGGKLAGRAPVPVITLAISDVTGDDPHVIGSGPTVLDGRAGDRVEVVGKLALFGVMVTGALISTAPPHLYHLHVDRLEEPLIGDVLEVATRLAREQGPLVAWGEPTVKLPPDPGEGGRATQLALALARHLRGSDRSAFVAASDGKDANTSVAGAYVEGTTWDRLTSAGIDPDAELARCNATHALARVEALFTPGPTGINHADVVILG